MKCRDVQKKLVFFYYRESDNALQKELKSHLDSCPVCQAFYARVSSTLQNIDAPELYEKKPAEYWGGFTAQVMEKVQMSTPPVGWRHYIIMLRKLVPAVVAFALLLVVALQGLPRFKTYQAEKKVERQLVQDLELVEHLDVLENLELLENMEELEHWKG